MTESPAIWRADDASSVVVLETAAHSLHLSPADALIEGRTILTDVWNDGVRHLVLVDRHGRHRLAIKASKTRAAVGYLVAPDGNLQMRLAAIARLHVSMFGKTGSIGCKALGPTRYQTHRLILKLRILDHLLAPKISLPTLRSIAADIVYPYSNFGNAIEWKSSSARRQTQRLVSGALYLMHNGYRDLLKGQTARPNY